MTGRHFTDQRKILDDISKIENDVNIQIAKCDLLIKVPTSCHICNIGNRVLIKVIHNFWSTYSGWVFKLVVFEYVEGAIAGHFSFKMFQKKLDKQKHSFI